MHWIDTHNNNEIERQAPRKQELSRLKSVVHFTVIVFHQVEHQFFFLAQEVIQLIFGENTKNIY